MTGLNYRIFKNNRLTSFFKPSHKGGFSLVEMIVYVAIFSIIFSVILQLFWRVQLSGSRLQIANEVKENTAQVLQLITKTAREGDSLDVSDSVFDAHPGTLVIDDSEIMTFDTYEKDISIGGRLVPIRKLRLTQGSHLPIDITSDHVDVTNYAVTDFSQPGHPNTVQIDLKLSSINPDNDLDYNNSLSVRTSITFRKES